MSKLKKSQFTKKCGKEAQDFFHHAAEAVCRTKDEVRQAFDSRSMKMIDGVFFNTNEDVRRASLLLSKSIVELVGSRNSNAMEIEELTYKELAGLVRVSDEVTVQNFTSAMFESLQEYTSRGFSYVAPCELFFVDQSMKGLISDFVSVVRAEEFVKRSWIPKAGKNWSVKVGDGFANVVSGDQFNFVVGGLCWDIHAHAPKSDAVLHASWMADVFTSLVRLAITPADYCRRARIGQIEPSSFAPVSRHEVGIVYDKVLVHAGGDHLMPQYHVAHDFSDEFHSEVFQRKLSLVFQPDKGTLAERIANGLGWLTRGRQSADTSERVLYFFTAMEAMLSDGDAFAPVSDSISRYVSIILAKEISYRKDIYEQVRGLYSLRSSIVHRGIRSAHVFDSNTLQFIVEACYSSVLDEIDLAAKHRDFLSELKQASHGDNWPITASR